MKVFFLSIIIFALCSFCFAQQKPEKLTAEEIVAKHLASIGTPGDIAAVTSRVMTGEGKIGFTPTGVEFTSGVAQLASTGDKLIFAMIFEKKDYPYEKVAFDGKEQTVGHPNGGTTLLSEFLKAQNSVLKEGLFGGALSTAWPLLDLKANNAKIGYGGTEEIDGKPAYKLKYTSRVGNMQVNLYFDANDFHHIRTEYKYTIEAAMASVATDSSGAKPAYFTLTEDFHDFKKTEKLTLPMSYRVSVIRTAQGFNGSSQSVNLIIGGNVYLTAKFVGVVNNEPLDPAVFKIS